MKHKLKHNPFLHTAVILVVLFVILIMFAIGMFYYVFAIPEPEGFSLASWPNTFTDNFSEWIEEKNGSIGVKEIGIERLDKYGLWVQIVDENGQERFAHNKPAYYPDSYSMAEMISLAESRYENGYTVFINTVTLSDRTLNYVIGFPYAVGKYMLYYNGENVARLSPFTKTVVFLSAAVLVFCAFAYTFWLSRKLSTVIGGIRNIMQNNYKPLKEAGIFGETYNSLNKMNMEIRRSEKVQQETDRTRKEWITNITHDLKTPLSPIKGYAELLSTGSSLDLQTVQDWGKLILKNADYMETLMNDLKLTYQLEAGAIPYTPQEIRIVRFLKELVIDIINDPAFSKRTIAFESGMSELIAVVDPDLLRRAVGNIVINALVHNPPDTKVKITVNKTPDNCLSISICDNGSGMDETELSDLWNRYYRGTNTKERSEGSGLGLAIAKQIVTLHGGEIAVKSSPGVGTKFIILLPLGAAAN
ncbi:MAG: HAMP domain-containing histidine kinase [Clostridia bacterium]|nr:HAMP domain-containing histidine kinase [Clostridia bacterium]